MPTPLTNAMRAVFVRNVIGDIDTKMDGNLIEKLVLEEALAALPPAVLKLWKNTETRPYLSVRSIGFPSHRRSKWNKERDPYGSTRDISAPQTAAPGTHDFRPSAALAARVKDMQREVEARIDSKEALEERMRAMTATCKTVEALMELFPDLHQYMPKPTALTGNVPAVMVKDFMQELGKLGVPAPKAVAA